MSIQFLQFIVGVLFLTVVFNHLVKKNFLSVVAFGVQSFIVALVFLNSFFETGNLYLFLMAVFTFVVKVILAPLFFTRLINKYKLSFSVSTYFSMPVTLIFIAGLTFLAHSQKFILLTTIVPDHQVILSLALASLFVSLFLIVNRKESLSQVISILSLENSVVVFAIFAGLEQSPSLQLGIVFNIFVWIVIATVFISMIYKHFGSSDVTSMNNLKD